jgi:DnaJ-class molecular chaperone
VKDYYNILGISREATEEEVRRAYRRLALQHHPDRNPGDGGAEERFKRISEAYGVLIDPMKRGNYDQWTGHEASRPQTNGFGYSQEEIFRDMFKDPQASQVFRDLLREFERMGVRFDPRFFDQMFFGGRGTLFGGIFVWGPFGSSRIRVFGHGPKEQVRTHGDSTEANPGVLERLGRRIGGLLLGRQDALPTQAGTPQRERDLHYHLTLPEYQVRDGTHVKIAIDRGAGREHLQVRIPSDTRPGTRLRVKGKGLLKGRESGDLYLTIEVPHP